jgi:hypothetical protein
MTSISDNTASADIATSFGQVTDPDDDTGLRHGQSSQRGGNNMNIRSEI